MASARCSAAERLRANVDGARARDAGEDGARMLASVAGGPSSLAVDDTWSRGGYVPLHISFMSMTGRGGEEAGPRCRLALHG